ncbi:Uncharacterized protein QTN25_006603 [Entamoeba marina]
MQALSPQHGRFECTLAMVGGEWCFIQPNTLIKQIQKDISRYSNPKQTQIKSCFSSFYPKKVESFPINVQLFVAYEILRNHANLKLVGILLILKNIEHLTQLHLEDIGLILDKSTHDHSTADCIATKLLYELIVSKPSLFLESLKSWKDSKSPWRMRACCSTFTKYCKDGKGNQIWDICDTCVRFNERVVQLGVGCSMKDLGNVDEDKVVDFIRKHVQYFSRDGLKYSVEKLKDATVKRELLGIARNTRTANEFVGASNRVSSEDVSN